MIQMLTSYGIGLCFYNNIHINKTNLIKEEMSSKLKTINHCDLKSLLKEPHTKEDQIKHEVILKIKKHSIDYSD